ncbi:MAG: TIGR00730 family Rossman fold protein [Acidimicrobiales bacterium]
MTNTGSDISSICVYCASSNGTNQAATDAAVALGHLLAAEGIELVYGGGAVGLMGLIADTVMAAGGQVTGIIPASLMPREVAHRGITDLIEVDSMHERKAMMIERADAFVAMPGGFGTLEELAEVLTWAQLGIHNKPIGLLNPDGFYDHLLALLDRCIEDQVLKEKNRQLLLDSPDPAALLALLRSYEPSFEPKWISDGGSPIPM